MGDLTSAHCNWGLKQGEGTHGCSHQWLAQHGPLSSSPIAAPEGLPMQISKAAAQCQALHGLCTPAHAVPGCSLPLETLLPWCAQLQGRPALAARFQAPGAAQS